MGKDLFYSNHTKKEQHVDTIHQVCWQYVSETQPTFDTSSAPPSWEEDRWAGCRIKDSAASSNLGRLTSAYSASDWLFDSVMYPICSYLRCWSWPLWRNKKIVKLKINVVEECTADEHALATNYYNTSTKPQAERLNLFNRWQNSNAACQSGLAVIDQAAKEMTCFMCSCQCSEQLKCTCP